MPEPTPPSSGPPPRLDDLIALNLEIAALVKAGVPMELGLRGLSGSVPTRLGHLAERLADRLSSGRTLVEALEQEGPAVSPIYTAVVGAGLQSGRLAEALGSLTLSAQVEQDARQRVSLALVNPAIVTVVGYALFVLFVMTVAPAYLSTAEMFQFPDTLVFKILRVLHRTLPIWGGLIPIAALVTFVGLVLIRGRRAGTFMAWSWIPGVASVHRSLNWAQFVELLRLQVSHGLPLEKALRRAGDATDDRRLRAAVAQVGDELQRGGSLAEALPRAKALPPLMRWMLATSEQQGTLIETLQLLAESYRRRALHHATLFKFWLPVLTTVFISGIIVLAYSMLFFIPLRELWGGFMHE
ncbi:MAG: type II secretion system F family protein [Planctomycetota bacterium]